MISAENMELIRLLKAKEQELREDAKGLSVSSTSEFVTQHADMAKELAGFLEMFEENRKGE